MNTKEKRRVAAIMRPTPRKLTQSTIALMVLGLLTGPGLASAQPPRPIGIELAAGENEKELRIPLDWDGDGQPEGAADEDGDSEDIIAILDNDGDLQHLFTIVGPGADEARASGLLPDGETLCATGYLRLTADFDANGEPEAGIRCDNLGDIFGGRYTPGKE